MQKIDDVALSLRGKTDEIFALRLKVNIVQSLECDAAVKFIDS